jgi:ATP-binding cassette subfamily C protein CydD
MEFLPALTILILAPEVYFPLRNAASLFHASADGAAALAALVEIEDGAQSQGSGGTIAIAGIDSLAWREWRSPFGGGVLPAATLTSGDVLVIRGGSGLGKSTFLNSLLGLRDAQEIFINGRAVATVELKSFYRHVGWIPQNPSLISGTVRELFSHLSIELSDQEITALLLRVGLQLGALPHGLDTQVSGVGEKSGEISGGQKRRLAIARALAINPSLIIADEVTADLDPASAREILEVLTEAADSGAILIVVLHAPDQSIAGAHELVMAER